MSTAPSMADLAALSHAVAELLSAHAGHPVLFTLFMFGDGSADAPGSFTTNCAPADSFPLIRQCMARVEAGHAVGLDSSGRLN